MTHFEQLLADLGDMISQNKKPFFQKDECLESTVGIHLNMTGILKHCVTKVHEFHGASDIMTPIIVQLPTNGRTGLRVALIVEEATETIKAPDIYEFVDGCIDTMYVIAGTLLECGIHEERLFTLNLTPSFVVDPTSLFSNTRVLFGLLHGMQQINKEGWLSLKEEKELSAVLSGLQVSLVQYAELVACLGLDPFKCFDIVHAANQRKVGADGKCVKRADGKILKPEGWYGPEQELREYIDNTWRKVAA